MSNRVWRRWVTAVTHLLFGCLLAEPTQSHQTISSLRPATKLFWVECARPLVDLHGNGE